MNAPTVKLFATTAEYAAHRGVDDSLIRRWRRDGRLVLAEDGKLIAIHASDALLAQTLHPSKGGDRRPAPAGAGAVKRGGNADAAAAAAAGATKGSVALPAIDFHAESAREKRARASMAELELAEKAGSLVPRVDVEHWVTGLAVSARETLLALPGRLAAELFAAGSVDAIEALLSAELRLICERLTEAATEKLRESANAEAAA